MRTQPKAVERVHWHANVRQARFLGSIEVLGIASVGVGHIDYGEACQGQDDVRHHVAQMVSSTRDESAAARVGRRFCKAFSMSTPPLVRTHPGTGEGCAEELASLTAALSVGRGRVGGMIDGVGRRRGRVMHTAVSEQYAEPAGGLTAIARCVPSEDLN
jgi:hypothetical protein